MKQVEYWRFWLPPRTARGKPYLSSYAMTAEEAAKRGALRPEPTSREVRQIPDKLDINGSFSHVGRGFGEPT